MPGHRQPVPLQLQVARVSLAAVAAYGYALGGGLALIMHGVVDRPTEDIDVFGPDTGHGVGPAAEAVEQALRAAGFQVERVDDGATGPADWDDFVVEWEVHRDGQLVRISISVQGRRRLPVVMDIGPVIAVEDLIAWKVSALVGRRAYRDYVDTGAALATRSPEELLELAREVEPELDPAEVAAAGRRLDASPDEAFARYGLDHADVDELRARFRDWPR